MAKARANITLDPHVLERAKSEFDSVSEEVEDALRKKLELSGNNKVEPLKEKRKNISEELEELKEERKSFQSEITHKENELEAIDTKIEKLKRHKEEKQDEMERFKEVFNCHYNDDWREPEDINNHWSTTLDKSKEELWGIGEKSVQ